jgi:hypothetical protein
MSDIIYTPPASSGGTTINPTNNRIPKRQNATTFADSVLENGTNYLYSNYGGYTGLGLDFLNFVSYLGDWNNLINGTSFVVNDASEEIYTKNDGLVNGINISYVNNIYQFGDFNTVTNGNSLQIDNGNRIIKTTDQGNNIGILLDFSASQFIFGNGAPMGLFCDTQTTTLGDWNGNNNRTQLIIDDNQQFFVTYNNGNAIGLELNIQNDIYYFGDFNFRGATGTSFHINNNGAQIYTQGYGIGDGIFLNFTAKEYVYGDYGVAGNGTYLLIRDNPKRITLNTSGGEIRQLADILAFDGTLTTPTTTGFAGQHLQVTINGTPYVIRLYNP